VLVWFATLVTLTEGLRLVKFLDWFAAITAGALKGMPIVVMVGFLVAIFFLVHYMFASLVAHTAALLPVFLAIAMAVPEMPIKLIALMFCYTLGLMGILTPYAMGPSPIYYGSGYIERKSFWALGLIFGLIFLLVLLAVGYPYMRWFTA
jgi:L-tartrate/succinate antiporter